MPKMTRSHYNMIADATAAIIGLAKDLLPTCDRDNFAAAASKRMTEALAGTNSQFKADRFRERCLGIRRGR